ncbi:four helix bundle protein [Dyadobacter sandarakinus]|uniref:Four helix bundle protein n=1 Tax=Dyadobacter sandarakinus TaxID=2747268 RepID=A0ABX7I9S8_9BACT|nr:four helix bundle protein [Dyadobacter sandarakinus]QRR01716.1 four helix bundle protein [Dyadobacter sandarakinus]
MADDNKRDFVSQLQDRTKLFVLRSIKVFKALPATDEARIVGKQFLRSASSVGANYRAVCRARSQNEFFAKISITIEEADESLFWMEIMSEANILPVEKLRALMNEAQELVKILSRARKNTR